MPTPRICRSAPASPSLVMLIIAGINKRLVRSPVAPKSTSVTGGAGGTRIWLIGLSFGRLGIEVAIPRNDGDLKLVSYRWLESGISDSGVGFDHVAWRGVIRVSSDGRPSRSAKPGH